MKPHVGQIEELSPAGAGLSVRLAGMLESRDVPGSALTLEGKPATAAMVMEWFAKAEGGAFCRLMTDGVFDLDGVSAAFSCKAFDSE